MTNKTSRVQPAGSLAQVARRRRIRMATLAAAFSLFALYLAWHEAYDPPTRHDDESPITQALADDPAQSTQPAATAAADPGLVKRGENLARAGDCVA